VRRLFTWLAGAAGGVAAYRAATRHREQPAPVVADPAEELRAKLAQVRETEETEEPEEPEEPPQEPEMQPESEAPMDADARRRAVHENARAALDEMRSEGE
jgi:hypothetical protein